MRMIGRNMNTVNRNFPNSSEFYFTGWKCSNLFVMLSHIGRKITYE